MSKLSFEQLADLKLLVSVEGIGPAKIRNLLREFKNVKKILSQDEKSLSVVEGIGPNLALRIITSHKQRKQIEDSLSSTLAKLQKIKGNILTVWDEDYPPLLKRIDDPPLILYSLGSFTEQDNYSVAIVGTRAPSNYGKIQAEKIAAGLSASGITVTSGLARGIDSVAHITALKNNNRTIAVIGCGIDVVYPPESKQLYKKIAEKGLILSEFEPGTKPDAMNFPRRNRIISGLSLGCIIVETGIKGGALYTARFALNQNREVFAIPGNLGNKLSEGTNMLIQKGEAKLITNVEDVLVELNIKRSKSENSTVVRSPKVEVNLFEEAILTALIDAPLHVDKISAITNLPTSDCLVHLLNLEFKELVKQLPGKMFMKIE